MSSSSSSPNNIELPTFDVINIVINWKRLVTRNNVGWSVGRYFAEIALVWTAQNGLLSTHDPDLQCAPYPARIRSRLPRPRRWTILLPVRDKWKNCRFGNDACKLNKKSNKQLLITKHIQSQKGLNLQQLNCHLRSIVRQVQLMRYTHQLLRVTSVLPPQTQWNYFFLCF